MLRLPVSRGADGKIEARLDKSEWLEILPGVEVRFDPITPMSWRAAQGAAGVVVRAGGADPADVLVEAGDALSRALMYHSIREWKGVVGDDDQPIEPTRDLVERDDDGKEVGRTPGTISAFLSQPDLFAAADILFVMPYIRRLQEKNVSSASPDGTGEAATRGSNIAARSARRPKRAGAKAVPTRRTSPKPKKARSPGKS